MTNDWTYVWMPNWYRNESTDTTILAEDMPEELLPDDR